MSELLIRTGRKYRNSGVKATLAEIWRYAYIRKGLRPHIVPIFLESTETLLSDALPEQAKDVERYWKLPGDKELPSVPNKTWIGDNDFKTVKTHKLSESYVCELSNIFVCGPPGLAINSDGKVIQDTVRNVNKAVGHTINGIGLRQTYQLLSSDGYRSNLPGRIERIPVACSLLPVVTNYYHWTAECLPRLRGLEQYRIETGQKPAILLPADPPSWMIESLQLFGYESGDWLEVGSEIVFVDRLVVPRFPQPTPSDCEWIHQRAVRSLPEEHRYDGERVYVPRPNATRRRVVNDGEVVDVFTEFGFEPYALEEMSVQEQVKLFYGAEAVAGPHGAGLVNVIYGRTPFILELFGEEKKTTYYRLAETIGSDYAYVTGENHKMDIEVSTERIRQKLQNSLNKI